MIDNDDDIPSGYIAPTFDQIFMTVFKVVVSLVLIALVPFAIWYVVDLLTAH